MAQTALPAPNQPVRRRVLGGLLDADGWTWAIVKSIFWFVLIITLLGWIPDRAYYFTVQRTVELWPLAPLVQVPLVNFCPPENESVACPAPGGATLPWHPAPQEVRLPAARTDGVAAALGTTYLYASGSDGTAPVADTHLSHPVGTGNLDAWSTGPALPEARADASSVVIGTTLYVIGGLGPDGQPTDTVYSLTVGNDGTLPAEWTIEEGLVLPEARAGAAAVTIDDGIVLMGGTDGTAAQTTVWRIRRSAQGKFGEWLPQQPLFEANAHGAGMLIGDIIYLVGGTNDQGEAVATVQEGLVGGGPNATEEDPNAVDAWRVSAATNLPEPRTNLSGFTTNGGLYIQGGSDGTSPRAETYWATPDAGGVIPGWKALEQTALGEGIEGSTAMVAGSHAFILGGQTAGGLTPDIARANLAPQEPFFQLGLIGVTIPALQLQGEIGQQIGYLNAATVGGVNFVLLILVGYAFNHKEQMRGLLGRLRRRG